MNRNGGIFCTSFADLRPFLLLQDDLSEPEDMDNMMDIEGEEEELAPVDEERQGLQAVLDREEEVEEADDEGESENERESDEGGESKSAVDTQMDTQLDTQLDTQRAPADQDEEEEEEVRVQRSARSSVVHTYGRVRLGLDHTTTTTITRELDNTVDTQVETQRETQEYTSESVPMDNNNNQDEERDDLSLHSITTTRTTATTKTSKSKKSKSTGNMMYRLALEAEERRHRTRKGNNLVDDEAAEEEEEGLQAGLGDFGFGVTSNIREHDEEMVSFFFFMFLKLNCIRATMLNVLKHIFFARTMTYIIGNTICLQLYRMR